MESHAASEKLLRPPPPLPCRRVEAVLVSSHTHGEGGDKARSLVTQRLWVPLTLEVP